VRVVSSDEDLVIVGSDDGWYWVEFEDGERAYIFGELIQLPEGAIVAAAPTMTPSFTPTSTKTNTPTPTHTASPFTFDENLIIDLIELTMLTTEMPVESIQMRGNSLVVKVPDTTSSDSEERLNYRMGYVGALTGAIVSAYEGDNVIAVPPQQIDVEFVIGELITMRVTYNYQDGKDFIGGKITSLEFVETWRIE
jgi:hypothetical protein